MSMVQLVYASQPFGFDELTLAGILSSARHHNKRSGVTGSLICRNDLFLQMLEGEREAVECTYSRIIRDGRHVEVRRVWSGEADTRLFADWEMRHDPMRSWMWSTEAVRAGAPARASADEVLGIFKRVAAQS
jgi:hypothetical protein